MTEEQKLINVQIGKRLQTVRENMGYTQEAFAEVLSVMQDIIRSWRGDYTD